MTPPKYILPGQVVMGTRRCSERRFFLLPDAQLTEAFGYLVAHYAERYFVGVHVGKVLGNHWHIEITDYMGLRSKFFQAVHSGMAKVVNGRLNRTGAVWDNQGLSDVVLCDPETVLEKTLYICTNAVRHGIVKDRHEWTGMSLGPEDWGVAKTFKRPRIFTNLPETATLKTRPPACLVEMAKADGAEGYDGIRAWAIAKVDERQEALVEAAKEGGKKFLGMLRVRRMKRSDAPKGTDPKRGRYKPDFAAKDGPARHKAYLRRKRWLEGRSDVVFPKGTYWYKHFSPAKTKPDGTYGPPPD